MNIMLGNIFSIDFISSYPIAFVAVVVLLVWTVVIKGIALWQCAKRDEKVWFGVLLIINTLGILESIYLFIKRRGDRILES